MICAARDNFASVESIDAWMTEIQDETMANECGNEKPIVLVYTKSDKTTQEDLTQAEIDLGLGIVTDEQIQKERQKSKLKYQKSFNVQVDIQEESKIAGSGKYSIFKAFEETIRLAYVMKYADDDEEVPTRILRKSLDNQIATQVDIRVFGWYENWKENASQEQKQIMIERMKRWVNDDEAFKQELRGFYDRLFNEAGAD